MTGRKCSTCKHFEAAPIWRKGWCRNPLLYSPQQSHLVGEDDLDCERGMGNYWEAGANSAISSEARSMSGAEAPTPSANPLPLYSQAGQQIYSVSGSSGYSNEPPPDPTPPSGGRPPSGGGGGPLNYYSEERYWTDYLRIAAPILGVLLLVVLFWLWASSFLGDDDNGSPTGDATGTTTLPTIGPTATAGGTAPAGTTPTLPIVITTVTPPSGATNTPDAGEPASPTPETPATEIFPGAEVVVANTGGDGANLRTEPTSGSEIVTTLLDGTPLTVTGDSVEGDGLIWWPVTGADGDGWIAADFLVVA
jgi:hypothetical protein